MAVVGIPSNPAIVTGFADNSPARTAGILQGDRITAIDGKEIANWEQLSETVRASGGRPLHFRVRRATGAEEEVVVAPEEKPERSPFRFHAGA